MVTSGTAQPAQMHPQDTGVHVATWIVAMLGLFAATIGGWILLAPDDGTITVNGRTWAASDLTETWGPWLLIVGGIVAAGGMIFAAIRDRQHRANAWLVAAEVLVAAIGVAAAVFGFVALV